MHSTSPSGSPSAAVDGRAVETVLVLVFPRSQLHGGVEGLSRKPPSPDRVLVGPVSVSERCERAPEGVLNFSVQFRDDLNTRAQAAQALARRARGIIREVVTYPKRVGC